MKKIIPFIFVLIFGLQSKAQSYIPLPDSNAVWNVGWTPQTNKIFAVKGDSLYNSLTYKKYYIVNDTNLSIAQFTFYALVRQDVPNKKVFGIKSGDLTEKLMYNFNLNINDTSSVHPFDFGYGQTYYVKVIAKDSILINSQYRKRLKVNYWSPFLNPWNNPEYWIEGIGSTFGVFNGGVSGYWITDVCFPSLMCQKQNGVLNYISLSCITCFDYVCLGVGINENSISNTILNLYPNPTIGIFNIELNEPVNLKIYSATGALVYERVYNELGNFQLDISQFSNGIYNLRTESSREVSNAKLIKN